MIGIIPSTNKTFEVEGPLQSSQLIEGKLYYDYDERLFLYSTKYKRSTVDTGYFPIWDGNNKYFSSSSNKKYLSDVKQFDINVLGNSIDNDTAKKVRYNHRLSENSTILKPMISEGDNMFTQCVKGIICAKNITMVDLIDMAYPYLSETIIENYYISLSRIAFMRLDKWNIWTDKILHVGYVLEVINNNKICITYSHPKAVFTTSSGNYKSIIDSKDDPFKKIIRILIEMFHINKSDLKSDEIDDYTINNMMSTIYGNKAMSAQLFSRFIKMSKMGYTMTMYDKGTEIFKYREQS